MPQERTGVTSFPNRPLTLVGPDLKPGDKAPEFELTGKGFSEVKSSDFRGKPRVIATLFGISTGVCDKETKTFSEMANKYGDKAAFIVASMDLPMTLASWCGAQGVENITVASDYRKHKFAEDYGILIKETDSTARAVFVVDKNDVIRHVEITPVIGQEPNYAAVEEALKQVV